MVNKYGNVRTDYKGMSFHSKLEANHAKLLDTMRRAKDPKEKVVAVLYQYRMPIVVNNRKICSYVADFYVQFADGHKEVHETKGFKTAVYSLKKSLIEALYGDEIIKEIYV